MIEYKWVKSMATVTIRKDEDLKRQEPLNEDTTPNAQTLAAIEEVRLMKKDRTVGKSYTDAHEMIEDLK